MRKLVLLLCLTLFSRISSAENLFIRTNNNPDFGQSVRILPLIDDGWIVFSADSFKISRFDRCAQQLYSHKFTIPNDSSHTVDIAGLMDLGCAVLTQSNNGLITAPVITRIDSSGNIVWCKSFANLSNTEQACSISADSLGFIYFVSNVISGAQNRTVITVIDYSGNITSDRILDVGSNSGDAIPTSDLGMLIRSGNSFIKTKFDGSVEWATSVAGPASVFSKPVETGNGFVFSCNVTLTGSVSLMKLGSNGNIVSQIRTDFSGIPGNLRRKSNGEICGLFSRTNSGTLYSTLVDLDSNLNILRQRSIAYNNLNTTLGIQDFGFLNNGSPVIAGITNPTGFLIYGRTDPFYSTGCDTTFAPVQTLNESASQSATTVNFSPYSRIQADLPASHENFTDSQVVLCSIPDQFGIAGETLICGDIPVSLINTATKYFDSFLWSTGETAMQIATQIPGLYWLKGVGICDLDTVVSFVNVIKRDPVPFDLGDDRFKCEDNQLVLSGPTCDHCTYSWNDGSTGQSISVTSYGKQLLRVVNDGCATVDSVNVKTAKCECHFFLPNTITPNHDGVNDVLKPVYYCDLTDYSLKIFNRWGVLIFETGDVEQAWDARCFNIPVIQDVYVYLVKYTILTEGVAGEQVTKAGSISVVY